MRHQEVAMMGAITTGWLGLGSMMMALGVGCAATARNPMPEGLTKLDGSILQSSDLDGKVVMVVNVASKCGFTKQYDGLQALHEKYEDQGLVILGVPCNQFGAQEPGKAEEIQSFCRLNYGVSFPLLDKQDVNGSDRSPLYKFLIGRGTPVLWNFEKFLIGRDGKVMTRFRSTTAPDSSKLIKAVEKGLTKGS
jgi:glutathione peroxidase-family protein